MAAYRSTFVSAEQSRSWTQLDDRKRTNIFNDLLLVPITFWLTNVLLFVGSQPQAFQFVCVGLLNPVVLGVIASIGAFVVKQPAVGAPVLVAAAVLLCACWFIWLTSSDNSKNGIETMAIQPITFLQPRADDTTIQSPHKLQGYSHFELVVDFAIFVEPFYLSMFLSR